MNWVGDQPAGGGFAACRTAVTAAFLGIGCNKAIWRANLASSSLPISRIGRSTISAVMLPLRRGCVRYCSGGYSVRPRRMSSDPTPLLQELEQVIARLTRTGLLNDAAFAETKARSLSRRGGSRRQIAAKLAASGVPQAERTQAIAALEADMPDAEYAQRSPTPNGAGWAPSAPRSIRHGTPAKGSGGRWRAPASPWIWRAARSKAGRNDFF